MNENINNTEETTIEENLKGVVNHGQNNSNHNS